MSRRHDSSDLSSAAQEYLLALRVMAVDGSRVTASQVGRHLGVSTQAASEMFRRLISDGLVAQADGNLLVLTEPGRTAADAIFRRHALLEWLLTAVIGSAVVPTIIAERWFQPVFKALTPASPAKPESVVVAQGES